LIHTKPDYLNDETIIHFELNATSQLRAFLCSGAGPDCKSSQTRYHVHKAQQNALLILSG
jgi:hypothetical protein